MIDATRVRELLAARAWTQSDLARLLGVSASAISQVMTGKTRDSRLIPSLAAALGVSVPYLTGESDDPFHPVSGTLTPRELAAELKLKLSGQAILGITADPEYVFSEVYDPEWRYFRIKKFDPDIMKSYGNENYIPGVANMVASTDAMSPTIMQGDEVYFSTSTRSVSLSDAIWLIDYGGLRMIRRLMPLPKTDGYKVYADNPVSPTFEAPANDIEILGRAFWIGRPLA